VASRRFGCARTTVYALVARYQQGGVPALLNRPRGAVEPVPEQVREAIVALKVQRLERSTAQVQQLLAEIYHWHVSRQTVWRVLSEKGLARITDPVPLHRFEWPHPNQLWQLDLIEDVPTAAGRVHLVVLLDDASRYCVGGQFVRSKAQPVVLGVIAQVLQRQGLPEAILTDRATMFYGPATSMQGLTVYQLALQQLGIRACFAKPYKPRTKGKVEKFIQFVEHRFLGEMQHRVRSLEELNAAWEVWRRWYNECHCHSSLGEGTPARHYRKSNRPAPPELEQLLSVEEPRVVRRDATISIGGRSYPVPPQYLGRHVWVHQLGDQVRIVYDNKTVASFTR
jgi:transposase InsO family protein